MSDAATVGILTALFLVMAVLYSSVGQGGGSGYLAAMALMGVAPEGIRLTALTLNVVVAGLGSVKFARAGFFDRRLCLPFILASVPLAFVGGLLSLPSSIFKPLVGMILLWAALLLLWKPPPGVRKESGGPPVPVALLAGGGIGILSGLIGIGGGIFLAPLLLLGGWADPKPTAAVSSVFILVNSLAALVGVAFQGPEIPTLLPAWMAVVAVGGWVGAEFGANRLSPRALQRVLAGVLILAALKIIVGG